MRGVAAALGVLLVILATGCSDERPTPPRPNFRPLPEAPTAPPRHARDGFHRPQPDRRERPGGPAHPAPLRVTETREVPGMQEETRRDLSAELRAAMGDPSGCIPAGASGLPSAGVVNVDVHVSVTGIVTRARASASGFPAEMATCLTTRAQHLHLRGPIPGAPRQVSTRIEIRAAAPAPAAEP